MPAKRVRTSGAGVARARPSAAAGERTGATRIADIPPAILKQLNSGQIETRTLAEGLAIDFCRLIRAVAPRVPAAALAPLRAERSITRRMAVAAEILHAHAGDTAFERLAACRTCDTARGWAAYVLARRAGLSPAERLKLVRPLADDPHSGVREWAWLALRPHVAADLPAALRLLEPWVADRSANIRRYAVEITRPRGVWCAHLDDLKREPAAGRPLLEPLRSDPAKYVQDSVSNWLNDAAKSRPEWVRRVCADWLRGGASAATQRICRRAQRSI